MKKAAALILLSLTVLLTLLVYLAYFYTPPVHRTQAGLVYRSGPRIETRDFIFNSLEKGDGEPVILLHGTGTWLYSWRKTIDNLAQKHRVYAIDLPGHGYTRSKTQPARYDLELYAEAVRQYMDQRGIRKASFIGHSFGGGWALYFAARYPERVDKLILLAPRVLDTPYRIEWRLMQTPLIGELLSKLFRKSDVERGLQAAYFDKARVDSELIDATYAPLTRTENRRAAYRVARDSDWKLTERAMPRLSLPILAIWGKQDEFLPAENADRLKTLLPQASHLQLNECGHSLQDECADLVNLFIDLFLERETR